MRRCSLCGGRLSGNVCTECGLDNSKSDAMYEQGKHSCEEELLTHVHSEQEDPYAGKMLTKDEKKRIQAERQQNEKRINQKNAGQTGTYQMTRPGTRNATQKRSGGNAGKLITTIGVIAMLLGVVLDNCGGGTKEAVPESETGWETEKAVPYDPYELASRELSETGEYYETALEAGIYKGGVHIPEGSYTVTLESGTGSLSLEDPENAIYLNYHFGYEGEAETAEDIRIYRGAILTVGEKGVLRFQSENARMDLTGLPNPLSGTWRRSEGFEAGREVPAGVYDITCIEGVGILDYDVDHSEGYASYEGMMIEADSEDVPRVIRNVVLPEGTYVNIEGMTLELTPSETIESGDYDSFYPEY